MNKIIISIDGPAGSGKDRIARYVSKKWSFKHLDSGILYRRIANLIYKKKLDPFDKKNIIKLINNIKELSYRKHKNLRLEKISRIASIIAEFKYLRDFVNKQQKKIVKRINKKNGFVIDGRDIGSVVFKNANVKLYIDVDIHIRAKRRHKQLIDMGEKSIYRKILKDIKLRDKKDKTRINSPLVIPKGAFIIDNSSTFHSTQNQIIKIIGKKINVKY
ncbi:MAG: Cytidylate kinase [Alphaproteobacteria bacterium MarineAlpha5_Bin5]|nr:MAG: Cytidylate kinase [Alphaproteobacteria bacterium MarineAlpha5_Bin5]PPR52339.1 MAG: Cytidylate kinase [Alphaproteobacteria bacterium MarineAlpha5_Bin4]